ncbi:peptide ABC transporter substrate-binding protein [Macrococcus caseolyticus]|uniref:peptide ABC transporter substrate-binding protein n=1 Tax=Macrococcoides caseolyticum TaxID=69966 RepID=UPI0024BD095B|nr:peptide ABC transporter substrate-binding protein [Macrococcus caseolyticus]MDJ1155719.1 peptide ABC transporter substrate-binding protein [Macrococcus caseolyticus]
MKKNFSYLLVLVITLSGFLAACSGGNKSDGKNDQVLNLQEGSDIPTLDSSLATDAVAFNVFFQVMEGLYTLDKNDKAIPAVAEGKPEKSKDGKTWTIKLRKDAKWSNGDPVTAKDFVFAWRRTLDPKTASEYSYIMMDLKNAQEVNAGKMKPEELGVKAIDDNTLEIQLNDNVPYFEELLTFGVFLPQNEKFVKEQGDKYGTTKETTLFNGPFVLNDWQTEKSFKLTPNKKYWDKDKVKLKEVNYKIIKDQNTALNLFNTGKLDRVTLPAEQVDKYKDDPKLSTELQSTTFFIRMNQENKDLANKDLRLAIAKSIDKQAYVDTLLKNGSKPLDTNTPKEFVEKDGKDFTDSLKNKLSYNKEEAKAHFEKAKKALGKDSFTFEYLTYDQEESKTAGEYIKEQLENNLPGLKINIKQQPFKQKLQLESKMKYDLSFAGWGPDYPDPMTFVDLFVTDGGHNQTGWSNKEFDQKIQDAKGPLLDDIDKRWTTMVEAEDIVLEEAVIAPIYQRGAARLVQPHVKNFIIHKFGADTSLKEVYIEKKK